MKYAHPQERLLAVEWRVGQMKRYLEDRMEKRKRGIAPELGFLADLAMEEARARCKAEEELLEWKKLRSMVAKKLLEGLLEGGKG